MDDGQADLLGEGDSKRAFARPSDASDDDPAPYWRHSSFPQRTCHGATFSARPLIGRRVRLDSCIRPGLSRFFRRVTPRSGEISPCAMSAGAEPLHCAPARWSNSSPSTSDTLRLLSAHCGPSAARLIGIRVFAQVRPRAGSELRPVVVLELELKSRERVHSPVLGTFGGLEKLGQPLYT